MISSFSNPYAVKSEENALFLQFCAHTKLGLEHLRKQEQAIQDVFKKFCQPDDWDASSNPFYTLDLIEMWVTAGLENYAHAINTFVANVRQIKKIDSSFAHECKSDLMASCDGLRTSISQLGTQTLMRRNAEVHAKRDLLFKESKSCEVFDFNKLSISCTELSCRMMMRTLCELVIPKAINLTEKSMETIKTI